MPSSTTATLEFLLLPSFSLFAVVLLWSTSSTIRCATTTTTLPDAYSVGKEEEECRRNNPTDNMEELKFYFVGIVQDRVLFLSI
jgi:hypothetical protein